MVTTITRPDTITITRPVTKKERIVAAAIRLWRQAHNVNKVSLADIAAEAGVSQTTIYNNFGTRDGLVEEVIKHLMQDVLAKQQAILKSDLPFPQKMQGMISAKMSSINGMQVDLLDKVCTDPVAKRYVDELTETEAKPMMKAIIKEGKSEGYIRLDVPDEVIMLYFDILKAGGATCSEEMRRIVADKNMLIAMTRLMYFGLFQQEFDVTRAFNNAGAERAS